MSIHAVKPEPPVTRERLARVLESLLRGPDSAKTRRIVLGYVDRYAAHLIEEHARPPAGPKPRARRN